MKFTSVQTLSKIANLLECNFIGNDDFPVLGMNEIHVVEKGDIVFVDHPKYYRLFQLHEFHSYLAQENQHFQ